MWVHHICFLPFLFWTDLVNMTDIIREDGSFNFWVPATIEKGSDGKMWVSGIASTEHEDLQGEKIRQDGIDLSYFLARGFLNDDHSKDTGGKVGVPTQAKITKQGLWIKGYLLDTSRAKSIYELATALHKAGGERQLGYSVEGKVLARDSRNPKIITKCWLKDVAITASPINPHSFLELAKSFNGVDCTQVFVEGTEEVLKAAAAVSQIEEEKADAEKTAQEALATTPTGTPKKKDIEKDMKDVPIAKRAFKSISLDEKVTLQFADNGDVTIKGIFVDSEGQTLLKLPKSETNHVENPCQECGATESCDHRTDKFPKLNIKQGAPLEEVTEVKDWKPVQKTKNSAVKSLGSNHSSDEECSVGKDGMCTACGVLHGDACKTCGGKGFHKQSCDAPATSFTEGGPARKSEKGCGCCGDCTGKKDCKCCDKCGVEKCMDKSVGADILAKSKSGFTKKHEVGGEREYGSKKIPIHVTSYDHPTGHNIIVTGDGDAFSVNHAFKGKDNKIEMIGGHLFHDDPAKGKKAKEDCDAHLKGFGITHRFCDKKAMLGKALVTAQDNTNSCDTCGETIPTGEHFIIKGGHTFDDEDCLEKALIAGYQFGVTDQENGSALRVESLEGSQKDTSYGGLLDIKVKDVKFDTARANGGKSYVTLRDAIEFLTARGMTMGQADRLMILLVKNGYDLSKIANGVGNKK